MKDIKVTLIGNKRDGFILEVVNKKENFKDKLYSNSDIALQHEELVEIKKVLDKKIK